ncbi:MAG TPA: hypothetical protein VKM72_24405 [Thermoanaerobaculia bacterium]|nr:hypothetical protein [Thermoanaerobaculia bacterium]
MKRAALLVLTLALVLPLTVSFGESPASAQTCQELCAQENFQCQQTCQGTIKAVQTCRAACNDDYYACVAGCP